MYCNAWGVTVCLNMSQYFNHQNAFFFKCAFVLDKKTVKGQSKVSLSMRKLMKDFQGELDITNS